MQRKPLIGLPACVRQLDGQPFHVIGDKYVRAIAEASDAIPLVLPALGELLDIPAALDGLDGILLTGSPSNVHPDHYGQAPSPEHEPYDLERDRTTLPLIRALLEGGLPFFAIRRGMQELNVALGGTLHPRVHELAGRLDHRRPESEDLYVQYGKSHLIEITPGGFLQEIAGGITQAEVNSLHWQALDRVAEGLDVEAVAPDGTVEAVKVRDAKSFALAVQWHPEYKVREDSFSLALFRAFGAAARSYAQKR